MYPMRVSLGRISNQKEIKEEPIPKGDENVKVENGNKSVSNPFEESFSFISKAEEYFETNEASENKEGYPEVAPMIEKEKETQILSTLDQRFLK